MVRTLRNAIEQGKVHHAYLFVGSRGTGKTSMAKILAASLNCVNGADGHAVRAVRVVPLDRQRDVARRDRDGRGVQQLGRRHPRPARARGLRAGGRPPQGLHPRRGAHALDGGVERVPQDARGAAAAHDLRARHDRGEQGAADGRGPLPPLRLRAPERRRRSPAVLRRVADAEAIEIPDEAVALVARSATGSFRDALGTLEQLLAYSGAEIALEDVLAVLGAADADLHVRRGRRDRRRRRRAAAARRRRGWPTPGATSAASSATSRPTPAALMVVQVLGERAGRAARHARAGRAARRAGRGGRRRRRRPAARADRRRAARDEGRRRRPHPARARARQGRAPSRASRRRSGPHRAPARRGSQARLEPAPRRPRAERPRPRGAPARARHGRRAHAVAVAAQPSGRRPAAVRAPPRREARRRAPPAGDRAVRGDRDGGSGAADAGRRGRRPSRGRPSPLSPPSSSRSTSFAELWPAVLERSAPSAPMLAARCSRARARRARRRRAHARVARVAGVLQAQGRGPGEQAS